MSARTGDALLDRLPRATLVVGKGGVGKTTCASALALRASERFGPTLLVSTDPARALPTVLGEPVGGDAAPLPYAPALHARTLDAAALRGTFLARWGEQLRVIIDRGTYLDQSDIAPLVDTALPGGDEIFAALALADILADETYARVFVDTAPTGHTLRLLSLPRTFRALVRLLDAMQAKHRFMVRTLTRAYRADEADAFLAEMTRRVTTLEEVLRDPGRCAALLVTAPQRLVLDESTRYLASLRELGIATAGVVWNGTDEHDAGQLDAPVQVAVPRLAAWPVGLEGLRAWFGALTAVAGTHRRPVRRHGRRDAMGTTDLSPLLRPLTIVAGKGGVGKTTVACALALSENVPALIVSTDPAPSLADALAQPIPDADTPVDGARGLLARQMDATAAFERLRTEYAARVDALSDALVGRGVDLSQDRAILRDLMALAPPGVDEVYALALLADAMLQGDRRRVIVDPAPTGHLLRLLEMPPLALAWTHQLMRLLLKYKEVADLGDTARDLLGFAKDLRGLEALLTDPERCSVVLVTLDEPVVVAETERLGAAVRERGVRVSGVVRNRASARGDSPLPVPDAPVHFEAPEVQPPPVGVQQIREWAGTWSAIGDARRHGR